MPDEHYYRKNYDSFVVELKIASLMKIIYIKLIYVYDNNSKRCFYFFANLTSTNHKYANIPKTLNEQIN